MVWIKICGITNKADALSVSGLGADALGFVFSTDSVRRVRLEKAKNISEALPLIPKAGVFVDEEIGKVQEIIDFIGLGFVQFCGEEDINYLKKIKNSKPGVKIIKAIRVKDHSYSQDRSMKVVMDKFLMYADYILLDSHKKGSYGGTGKALDWEKIKGYLPSEKLILSGGLYHKNIVKAMEILRPFGIDASSRLESKPGKKDHGLVKRFINEAKKFRNI